MEKIGISADFSLRILQLTSPARTRGFNQIAVDLFYDNFEKIHKKYDFYQMLYGTYMKLV